ncbi:hypothetical protein AA313_de0201531 [Arthrobotrys entomopaga]|nr:hypothetical protein AA313_de0201531 [Arthrobotrys entomopaga]
MSVSPTTVNATTLLLASLATGNILSPLTKTKLPGEDTPEKRDLERELNALASRIRLLELKASAVNPKFFPETPNDGPQPVLSPPEPTTITEEIISTITLPPNGTSQPIDIEPDLEVLKQHVKAQEDEIQSHGKNVEVLVEEINQHQHALQNVNQEYSRVEILEKELRKSQRANLAFQKALREIGEIVTAVAKGDLTKKVTVHDVEMDREIEIFKGTINNMTDQLQTFASEVSRVAREVGTEGRLGGQASVNGVEGTWRELTDNGSFDSSSL